MNTSMAFNRMMSRSEVIEKYGIPKEWEETVFRELQTIGSGTNEKYLKHDVDETLQRVFGKKNRPSGASSESSLKKEDRGMVSIAPENEPWARIAAGIERLVEVLVPKEVPLPPTKVVMLTPAEAAEQMRLNVQTVMKWCRQRKMGIKSGRKWLISPDEVDLYLRGVLLTKGGKAVAG